LPVHEKPVVLLICTYRNLGYEALADGGLGFYERRVDLGRPGIAFRNDPANPTKSPPRSAW
jgi:hypothetical protein